MDAHDTDKVAIRRPMTPEIFHDDSEEDPNSPVQDVNPKQEDEVISEVNTFFVSATERRPTLKDNSKMTFFSSYLFDD